VLSLEAKCLLSKPWLLWILRKPNSIIVQENFEHYVVIKTNLVWKLHGDFIRCLNFLGYRICVFSDRVNVVQRYFHVLYLKAICGLRSTYHKILSAAHKTRPQGVIMFSTTWNDSSGRGMTLLDSSRQKVSAFLKVNKREWLWNPTSDKFLVAFLAMVYF